MSEDNYRASIPVPAALRRAIEGEASLRSRIRYVAVGLAGGCGAALLALLWATEPGPLPLRTRAAFGGLITVGVAWAAFATWALAKRRPLYGYDQVLGASIAIAATAATTVFGVALTAARATTAVALGTGLAGSALVAVAVLLLVRARGRRRRLLRLRDELQQ